MVGLALSADDIKTAPPEVRRWLEHQVIRSSDKEPTPKLPIDPPTAPLIGVMPLRSLARKGVSRPRETLK